MRADETNVYLVGGDPDLSLSIKCLLESHRCLVEKIELEDVYILAPSLRKTDLILLDLNRGGPSIFKLVNHLMEYLIKPRILIMADETSDLRLNDVFAECEIDILLHPVNPKHLVNAIMGTKETEYQ